MVNDSFSNPKKYNIRRVRFPYILYQLFLYMKDKRVETYN